MKFMRFISKNWLLLLLALVIITYFSYNYIYEGFKRGDMLNEKDCRMREKKEAGSYTWRGGKCYAPCGVGKKMRGKVNRCGPLNDKYTDNPKKYQRGSAEYARFYTPDQFTARSIARYN